MSQRQDGGEADTTLPIVDLHCDLLGYLTTVEGARPEDVAAIGCAIPFLLAGNVKLQVLAVYTGTGADSPHQAAKQSLRFRQLLSANHPSLTNITTLRLARETVNASGIGVVTSIENASGLCTESEPLDLAFRRLETMVDEMGRILYITLTHHTANRFGGGNQTQVGLKQDGKALLEFLDGKRIAVDLSHTSDSLAHGILNHIDKQGLDVPVVASHSNFRAVFEHPRNLPDEIVQAVVERGGLIGINFVRAFVHPEDPSFLLKHIVHGFECGAQEALCFGGDFFYWRSHPDPSRIPFFFDEHAHAGKYQEILRSLGGVLGASELSALAYGNALRFLEQWWG
jgi:microsomal dipeptidase-like Zn-dependent dipeptidase